MPHIDLLCFVLLLISLRKVGRRMSHSFGLPPQEAPVIIANRSQLSAAFLSV